MSDLHFPDLEKMSYQLENILYLCNIFSEMPQTLFNPYDPHKLSQNIANFIQKIAYWFFFKWQHLAKPI